MRREEGGLSPDVEFEEDPRYAIANREAWWGVGYWALFTVVITTLAWWLGGNRAAEDLGFVLGFPTWFFWSCLVGAGLLSLLPIFLIRRFFTEVPLSADGTTDSTLDGAGEQR